MRRAWHSGRDLISQHGHQGRGTPKPESLRPRRFLPPTPTQRQPAWDREEEEHGEGGRRDAWTRPCRPSSPSGEADAAGVMSLFPEEEPEPAGWTDLPEAAQGGTGWDWPDVWTPGPWHTPPHSGAGPLRADLASVLRRRPFLLCG